HLHMTVQALQDELRIQRDLNQLLQQDPASQGRDLALTSEPTEENYRRLYGDHERQAKELFLLRKTLEEMELRIDTQKQTLGARDESIKKLLEMLQSKGPSAKASEEDQERTRRLADAEMHRHHLESLLDQRDRETTALREELHRRYEGTPESTKTKALQTRGLRDMEEEVMMLKSNGLLSCEERQEEIKQMEVDALRLRLEEKETTLNKKSKQIQEMSEEKGTLNGEIHDLKDMLEVKERKVNVLQKKIENLQEQLRDKEKQMSSLKERVKSLQADTSNTDTALTTLEESLAEKERIIERLKEQRDRDDREKTEEIDSNKKELKDLKEKVSLLQGDLSDRETNLLDLKEHASSLASSGLKKDSKLKSMEISLEQRKEAFTRHREDSGKAQAEVDRLLEILREMENEKNDKDRKINELERQTKDQSKKVASLKHKEQVEKSRNAQLKNEAKKREDNISESSQQVKDSLRLKTERIEELEEALRESIEELLGAMEKVKQELESMRAKLSSTQQSLCEKEAHLTTLRVERRKHLEEVLEMKQEALLAAISEKDANIALLELSSSKKKKTQDEVALLKREKDRLVQQLKQQTQNRMKLMADNYEDDHLKTAPDQTNHKPSPDQLELCEKESGELQEYANSVLQQIADYCPDILEQVVNALEESC
ncbi:unnamed protein product, partial [Coregonus sp. 'balchen']